MRSARIPFRPGAVHPGRVVRRHASQHQRFEVWVWALTVEGRVKVVPPDPSPRLRGRVPRHESLRGDRSIRPLPPKPIRPDQLAQAFRQPTPTAVADPLSRRSIWTDDGKGLGQLVEPGRSSTGQRPRPMSWRMARAPDQARPRRRVRSARRPPPPPPARWDFAETLHLTRLGRASIHAEGIGHHEFVTEQERCLRPRTVSL